MKLSSLFFKARGAILLLLGVATLAVSLDASAIPVFARQTGFKCVACHVGGEYPQLTSLGRYFKLTGYTQGDAKDFWNLTTNIDRPPVAIMLQTARQYYANNKEQQNGTNPTSAYDMQVVSLFAGGHLTDNIGAFVQWTGNKYDGNETAQAAPSGTYAGGASGIDNTEFRYANHVVTKDADWIFGSYLNNRITMSDVWNTTENWNSQWIGYFNAGGAQAPTAFINGGASQHSVIGLGAYVFKDKTWYAEVAAYKSQTHGLFSIMTQNSSAGPTLLDTSPYFKLAYNKEWGPHNLELGVHGMVGYAHNNGTGGLAYSDWTGSISTYRDVAFEAQYQYILDPHYFSAHFRYTHENASNNADQIGSSVANPTNILNETWADVTYIYKAQYGAMLFYNGARGTNDATLNSLSATGSPDWDSWNPSIFWAPYQNIRLGYTYTFYTKMAGSSSASVGGTSAFTGLSPHDFNTGMLYATLVY